jgi:hypothetical protein
MLCTASLMLGTEGEAYCGDTSALLKTWIGPNTSSQIPPVKLRFVLWERFDAVRSVLASYEGGDLTNNKSLGWSNLFPAQASMNVSRNPSCKCLELTCLSITFF